MSKPSPIKTAADVLDVAGAGLTLADRLVALFAASPEQRMARRIARLRGRAARLGEKAKGAKRARRQAVLRAKSVGAAAEADALEGAIICD